MVDEATKKTLTSIPLLKTQAGPRDGDQWVSRLKEEYLSLIKVGAYRNVLNFELIYIEPLCDACTLAVRIEQQGS